MYLAECPGTFEVRCSAFFFFQVQLDHRWMSPAAQFLGSVIGINIFYIELETWGKLAEICTYGNTNEMKTYLFCGTGVELRTLHLPHSCLCTELFPQPHEKSGWQQPTAPDPGLGDLVLQAWPQEPALTGVTSDSSEYSGKFRCWYSMSQTLGNNKPDDESREGREKS